MDYLDYNGELPLDFDHYYPADGPHWWEHHIRGLYSIMHRLEILWAPPPPYGRLTYHEAEDEFQRIRARLRAEIGGPGHCQVGGVNGDTEPAPVPEQPPADSPSAEGGAAHSPDFRSVCWFGAEYTFTTGQAACVKVLWENWSRRTPALAEVTILDSAGLSGDRLRDVFNKGNHPAWGTMIVAAGKGAFRLMGPPHSDPPAKPH